MGQFNHISEKMQLRIDSAVDSGELTRKEADEKREHIAAGDKKFERMAEWKRVSLEDIEARIQAALGERKITQEQADQKCLEIRWEIDRKPFDPQVAAAAR